MLVVRNLSGLGALPQTDMLSERIALLTRQLPALQTMTSATPPTPPNPLSSILTAITGGLPTSAPATAAPVTPVVAAKPWYMTWWGVGLLVGGAYGGYRLLR